MRVRLGDLSILLESSAEAVREEWERLFAGWGCETEPELSLALERVERLPSLPALPPAFTDDRGIVDVYRERDGHLLHFGGGAVMRLKGKRAEGVVLGTALGNGQLEDITLTSLAPLLRGCGYYLLHAFAASRNGQALLICGRSGSGKTTSGASLLLGGWQFLANDAVLLQERGGAVFALPTPGFLQVRPPTLFLLPALRHRRGHAHAPTASYVFSAEAVSEGGWGRPAPVRALYFPHICEEATASHVEPLEQAVALARLVEESVDRWDTDALAAHVTLLQTLVAQARPYRLHLGPDVAGLPHLLARLGEEASP
jgi:hypothetical protein